MRTTCGLSALSKYRSLFRCMHLSMMLYILPLLLIMCKKDIWIMPISHDAFGVWQPPNSLLDFARATHLAVSP